MWLVLRRNMYGAGTYIDISSASNQPICMNVRVYGSRARKFTSFVISLAGAVISFYMFQSTHGADKSHTPKTTTYWHGMSDFSTAFAQFLAVFGGRLFQHIFGTCESDVCMIFTYSEYNV